MGRGSAGKWANRHPKDAACSMHYTLLGRGQLHDEVGPELFELDHRYACSLELEDEMEFPLGGLGVVNQSDTFEVGVADIDGAWQIGCADASKTQHDPRWFVGNFEGARASVRQPPVGGDSKKR